MNQPLNDSNIDWARYRAWLRLLASTGVAPNLRSKIDPSDLVQQTILQAVSAFPDFRGSTESEMMAWLQTILTRNVAHVARDFNRQRRDVDRELATSLEHSSVRLERIIADNDSDPLEQSITAERVLSLCEALEALPDGQREALTLHHWDGMAILDVAKQMKRTPVAVAGLLKRGMKTLRETLRRKDGEPEDGG